MQTPYYVNANGQTSGPFDCDQIQQMLASGSLTHTAKACELGGQKWMSISELFPPPPPDSHLPPPPPPLPDSPPRLPLSPPSSGFLPKTYRTSKVGLIYRTATGNILPAGNILNTADFRADNVVFTMRNGKSYTFRYEDCQVTDSVLGNMDTVTLKVVSQQPKRKLKIHILYPQELSKEEVDEVMARLNCGRRLIG